MIETTLFNKKGDPVAYITAEFRPTVFLWSGTPVAYLYEKEYVYGVNGRHLGWFTDQILFNNNGERIGFAFSTCPVSIAKEPVKGKRQLMGKTRPRCRAKSHPKFLFSFADQDLAAFLAEGLISPSSKEAPAEESLD